MYATEKMMEKLEPPLQKDNPNANLSQWLNHLRLSQNTIDSILSLRSQSERVLTARYLLYKFDVTRVCNVNNTIPFRQSWSRLRATQLFVEYVMLKHPDVNLKLLARRLCGVSARNLLCLWL